MARQMVSRLRVLIAVAAVPLVLWGVLPLVSHGDPSPGADPEEDRPQAKRRSSTTAGASAC